MIVIIGASGAVGIPAIRHLIKRGVRIRALTSNTTSEARLKSLGVAETIVGDFRKDEDVAKAISGARSVLLIPPAMAEDEDTIGKRVVAAAKKENVDHLVFISCVHPQIEKMAHHWHKLRVEEAVCESNLCYTILQPSMFMQNMNFVWPQVKQTGVVRWMWDAGQKFNFVDTADLGETIAIALTQPHLRNATFEICSGDTLTMHETAKIFSDSWGRPVRAERQDLQEFAKQGPNSRA